MELEKGPIPLYYQLKMVLRNKILSGEFSSSNPFPTKHSLCEEYKVSRSVVRKAFFEAYVPQDLGEDVNLEELIPPYLIHKIEQTSLLTLERARQVIYAAAASKNVASKVGVKQRPPAGR